MKDNRTTTLWATTSLGETENEGVRGFGFFSVERGCEWWEAPPEEDGGGRDRHGYVQGLGAAV